MSVTVKLSSPVKYRGGVISEITFREPTFKDLKELGIPGTADGATEATAVAEMFKYLVCLASVEEKALDMVSARDALACVQAIVPFFVPSAGPQT
jgi:hypothetical protein